MSSATEQLSKYLAKLSDHSKAEKYLRKLSVMPVSPASLKESNAEKILSSLFSHRTLGPLASATLSVWRSSYSSSSSPTTSTDSGYSARCSLTPPQCSYSLPSSSSSRKRPSPSPSPATTTAQPKKAKVDSDSEWEESDEECEVVAVKGKEEKRKEKEDEEEEEGEKQYAWETLPPPSSRHYIDALADLIYGARKAPNGCRPAAAPTDASDAAGAARKDRRTSLTAPKRKSEKTAPATPSAPTVAKKSPTIAPSAPTPTVTKKSPPTKKPSPASAKANAKKPGHMMNRIKKITGRR